MWFECCKQNRLLPLGWGRFFVLWRELRAALTGIGRNRYGAFVRFPISNAITPEQMRDTCAMLSSCQVGVGVICPTSRSTSAQSESFCGTPNWTARCAIWAWALDHGIDLRPPGQRRCLPQIAHRASALAAAKVAGELRPAISQPSLDDTRADAPGGCGHADEPLCSCS
jgi:hypothetical protein